MGPSPALGWGAAEGRLAWQCMHQTATAGICPPQKGHDRFWTMGCMTSYSYHMTRSALALAIAALLAVAACGPKGGPAPAGPEDDPEPRPHVSNELKLSLLAKLGQGAGCPQGGELSHWCIAADGWAGGAAGEIPAGEHLYYGFTVAIVADEPVEQALNEEVTLAAMGLKNDGGKRFGIVTDVLPQSQDQQLAIGRSAGEVARVLHGEAERAHIDPLVHEDFKVLPQYAKYPLTDEHLGWRIGNAARGELRRIGEYWVVLESPTEGPPGIFVSIFTDEFEAAK
jgi:hypothetical protein